MNINFLRHIHHVKIYCELFILCINITCWIIILQKGKLYFSVTTFLVTTYTFIIASIIYSKKWKKNEEIKFTLFQHSLIISKEKEKQRNKIRFILFVKYFFREEYNESIILFALNIFWIIYFEYDKNSYSTSNSYSYCFIILTVYDEEQYKNIKIWMWRIVRT